VTQPLPCVVDPFASFGFGLIESLLPRGNKTNCDICFKSELWFE